MRKLLKIVLSLFMLWLVFRLTDSERLLETLTTVPAWALVVLVLSYFLGQALSAYKWWLITKAADLEATFLQTLKAYYIGTFVNCFGLGVLGGDATRALLLTEKSGAKTPAFATVVADRLQGLAILALIGLISAAIVRGDSLEPSLKALLWGVAAAIIAGWWIGPWLLKKIVPLNHRFRLKAEQVADAFPKSGPTLIAITLISLLFHLNQIWMHRIMGQAIGIDIPWATLLVVIPIVNILATLPISWNGLGVRESTYLYFLAPLITPAQSVALGALWLLAVTATSTVGGIVAMMTKEFRLGQKA